MTQYWVRRWLDAAEVSAPDDVMTAAEDGAWLQVAADLALAAYEAEDAIREQPIQPRTAIASRSIDLSGLTTCSGAPCLQRELDLGLSNSFQYFDHVVVEGFNPAPFLFDLEHDPVAAAWDLAGHAKVLLHAEAIGAEPFLDFRTKPNAFCTDHFERHAREIGLETALDPELAAAAVNLIRSGATVKVDRVHDQLWHRFKSPVFENGTHYVQFPGEPAPTIDDYATKEFRKICTALVGDVAMSEDLAAPITADAGKFLDLLPSSKRKADLGSVALSLELPVLHGLATSELLKVRADHGDQFEILRGAITAAIQERLKADPDRDPAEIARGINTDYIEPEMARIRLSMNKAREGLTNKLAGGITIGAVVTVVGIVTALPLLIAPGLAAVLGAPALGLPKYWDDKNAVEMKDLYFLHLAERRFSHKQ